MKRINVFSFPHKGIRYAFPQLIITAGKTNYSDLKEVIRLYYLGSDVFKILHLHAADENEVTLKKLENRLPGAADHNFEEHEHIEFAQSNLEYMLKAILQKANEGEDASLLGYEFYQKLNDFYADYLKHMAEEEKVTQKLLWDYFTDEELLEIRKEIMSRNSAEDMLVWFKFILPAINSKEKEGLMRGVKNMNNNSSKNLTEIKVAEKIEEFETAFSD